MPFITGLFKSSESQSDIEFEQLPFDHPLYIMYSSGTTGLPKCMVQSAGGILVHHLKELMLHTDLKREDTIFYFTTCGWMMWNWLVSSLAVGATLVLYDGNPFHPDPGALWKMAQDEKITVFGTSAGYIAALQNAGVKPGKTYDLTPLRAVLQQDRRFPSKDLSIFTGKSKRTFSWPRFPVERISTAALPWGIRWGRSMPVNCSAEGWP